MAMKSELVPFDISSYSGGMIQSTHPWYTLLIYGNMYLVLWELEVIIQYMFAFHDLFFMLLSIVLSRHSCLEKREDGVDLWFLGIVFC